MIIGGLQKFSILDYPQKISAIVFTQNCNFRCHFCYNPKLVLPKTSVEADQISSDENKKGTPETEEGAFFDFLNTRRGKLDAVVITGGEPTLHDDLPEFIKKIKVLGFATKLDTNGTNPGMLKKLLSENLLDYIAMDIKGPLEKYQEITGVPLRSEALQTSISTIMASELPYEFRTTVVPKLIKVSDIEKTGVLIRGAEKWYLQQFKSDVEMIDDELRGQRAYDESTFDEMLVIGKKFVKECLKR